MRSNYKEVRRLESVDLKNDKGYELRNQIEGVVKQTVDRVLTRLDVCKCPKCKLDIMAYALNLLPQKYVVTDMGELYSRLSEFTPQFQIDVEVAVAEAIKVVTQNPRH
jgi:competence protein ComFB